MTRLPYINSPVDGLVSYHYFATDAAMHAITQHGTARLIGDSGAFSAYTQGATIRTADYASWVHRWRPHLFWAASLDVIGDAEASYHNWLTLKNDHGLDTVPTIHHGADHATWMRRYADHNVDFMGLGGMVGAPNPVLLRWMLSVIRYARTHHPRMRFHAWGVSGHPILSKLPLYSGDSSGPLGQAPRFNSIPLWHPERRRMVNVPLDGKSIYAHRDTLRRHYRVAAADVAVSTPATRRALSVLAVRSTALRANHLQHLHKVTPPTWGLNPHTPHPTGTLIHHVSTKNDTLAFLAQAAKEHNP